MTDNLQEFLDSIEDITPEPIKIDLSGFSKIDLTLVLREPDAGKVYDFRQKMLTLVETYKDIDTELLSDIIIIASLVIDIEGRKQSGSGKPTSTVEFIRKIAVNKNNPRLWNYILARAKEEFPYVFNSVSATAEQLKELYKECKISEATKFQDLSPEQMKQLRILFEKKVSVGCFT